MPSLRPLLLALLLVFSLPLRADGPYHPSGVEVFFSPKGGCTEAVVAELSKAKSTVYVQAYSFTSAPIAQALADAHKRGVVSR
jgi:phosphatidylserine/phosphatidylglycerophosphate/cardiolipin synthase-like enzyme